MALQKSFRGFPDHVGIFSGGSIPFDLSQVLSPAVDANDFINPPEALTRQATLTAKGQALVETVPAGELWRVTWCGGNALAAGGTHQWRMIAGTDVTLFGLDTSEPFNTWAAGDTAYVGFTFPSPGLVLRPGYRIGVLCRTLSAGNASVEIVTLRQKIRI